MRIVHHTFLVIVLFSSGPRDGTVDLLYMDLGNNYGGCLFFRCFGYIHMAYQNRTLH